MSSKRSYRLQAIVLDVLGMNRNQEKDFYLKDSHVFKDQQIKEPLGTIQNKVDSTLTLEEEVDFHVVAVGAKQLS